MYRDRRSSCMERRKNKPIIRGIKLHVMKEFSTMCLNRDRVDYHLSQRKAAMTKNRNQPEPPPQWSWRMRLGWVLWKELMQGNARWDHAVHCTQSVWNCLGCDMVMQHSNEDKFYIYPKVNRLWFSINYSTYSQTTDKTYGEWNSMAESPSPGWEHMSSYVICWKWLVGSAFRVRYRR